MGLSIIKIHEGTKEKQPSKSTDWNSKIAASVLCFQWFPSLQYLGTSCAFVCWNEREFTQTCGSQFLCLSFLTYKMGRQRFSILESLQNEYSKIRR